MPRDEGEFMFDDCIPMPGYYCTGIYIMSNHELEHMSIQIMVYVPCSSMIQTLYYGW